MSSFSTPSASPPERDPLPWRSADGSPPAAPSDWRESTLRRLEAWIEEEVRLIAEIERRIAAVADRSSPAPDEPECAALQSR